MLTSGADGVYSYQLMANTSRRNTDVFIYTIKDGDGDTSTTTLTIDVTNVTVVTPMDTDVPVNEAGLDTTITGSDLAAGKMTGSLGTASDSGDGSSNRFDGRAGPARRPLRW